MNGFYTRAGYNCCPGVARFVVYFCSEQRKSIGFAFLTNSNDSKQFYAIAELRKLDDKHTAAAEV